MATRRVDDSDEGEATALDLRPSSRSAARPDGPSQPRAPSPPKMPSPLPAPIRRANLADQSSEDDEEATEFLSVRPPSRGPAQGRPSSTEAVPRAQGRAVPIEGLSSQPSQAPMPAAAPAPAPLPTTAPDSIRPLPHRTIGTDLSATGTSSVPRVTRLHVVAKGASTTNGEQEAGENTANDIDADATIPPGLVVKAPSPPPAATNIPTTSPRARSSTRVDARDEETQAGDDPDDTQAPSAQEPAPAADPPPRALPTSAEGDAVPARSRPQPRQNVPEAATDGVLVVDAPAEATVFVNGVERGRGTVKVGDLDREARHAVRIHCPGFSPWSGSVSLQGKPAAKIRPGLKPRAR